MSKFRIGDNVVAVIEGRIVDEDVDEGGRTFEVEYTDLSGVERRRWLYAAEIYHDNDDAEVVHVAAANASLH